MNVIGKRKEDNVIHKVSSIGLNSNYLFKNNTVKNNITNPINNDIKQSTELSGIPYSYISFKGTENVDDFTLAADGRKLLNLAEIVALQLGHDEITPYHIIQAAISETAAVLSDETAGEDEAETGEPISTLHEFVNQIIGRDVLEDESEMEFFINSISYLNETNMEYLKKLPAKEDLNKDSIKLSDELKEEIKKLGIEDLNAMAILSVAFNTLTQKSISFPSEFILNFATLNLYKTQSEIDENYLNVYDSRAIEVWNKLALGSSLFITSKNKDERDKLEASIIKTLDEDKHGNFNSDNTYIYSINNNADIKALIENIKKIQEDYADKKLIFMLDMDELLEKLITFSASGTPEVDPTLFEIAELADDKTKFLLLQNDNTYYTLMMTPAIKKQYNNFINYSIPPIHSHEVSDIFKNNKKLLKDVSKPFTQEAREKTILLAEKMEGSFPDKAVDLMKRIAEYYGSDTKKITLKEVEEFSYIASDLFTNEETNNSIIYNTGKTLADYYGKETTKKDIEALVRQIKTGRAGTQGIIITAKDNEAGAGKKHTAKVIAGEAKVPFMELDSSDFAVASYDADMTTKIPPANLMNKLFTELKNAAKQNQYRTAVLYINNFDDFAISSQYYPGYKQASMQLIKEMEKTVGEDLNIIVIGGSNQTYAPYIPMFVKDFTQNIVVDSPAYNKNSRNEILRHFITQKKLPLQYKTVAEKEVLINKLVKMTEHMSYVDIKNLITKTEHIMLERNKKKAGIGEFIEAYLQLATGRTSLPDMPQYNKDLTTSHECGHATNLEIMNHIYSTKGKPWYKHMDVNFITLDPRGDFLGAVFEGRSDNRGYPFEAMFSDIVCSYGGHSCEKRFFEMDGSAGISSDLAHATSAARRGVEYFGLGHNTGKISNASRIKSPEYDENVYKDMENILAAALLVSDLITEYYAGFNKWFTQKYSKLIGTDNCMVDGDDFRKELNAWIASRPQKVREELDLLSDMIMDVIKDAKKGKFNKPVKKLIK